MPDSLVVPDSSKLGAAAIAGKTQKATGHALADGL
jgi:hypothetical protein